MGAEGASAIGKLIEVSAVMTELDLSFNKIGNQGAVAIAEALKVNAVMTELWLGNNNIGDEGAKALASALEVNAELKLEALYVPSAIEKNPQLVAACREKGVNLNGSIPS